VIILGLLLAAAVVVLVALPFLREPQPADDRLDAPTDADERRFGLVEERDRALAALKELEFDHRTGKVDDTDYRELVGPLRQAAAAALRALDADRGYRAGMTPPATPESPQLPPEPAPPPDEGTPPSPAPVPEPYPPPDEITVPAAPEE
jgi:predicted outer membrane lipoprotein